MLTFLVVNQECRLFHATIKENILLGRPYARKRLWHACRIANLDDFIQNLPKRMETVVGERGVALSGGQRQRLAIARAIYGRPEILVLDEETSALDTESEKTVQDAINHALQGFSGIVIAHRLSTILHADKIIVMNQGRVEAMGSHNELLATSATYRKLYEMQFKSIAEARERSWDRHSRRDEACGSWKHQDDTNPGE